MQNSGSFDRFTERARKVLTLAQEEAQRCNHNYIGTEHLLLGLVREGEGVAAKVLSNLGIELSDVRSAVESIIGAGERQVMGDIGLTPRAKHVIEFAVDEARRLGHHYIGTEHLLLGMIREGEGVAARVLKQLDVSLEKVRSEVIKVLTQTGSSPDGTRGPEPSTVELPELPGFTPRARMVVALAQKEARRFKHNYIGTEHLLLGLLREGEGTAARALRNLGVELQKVRNAVEFIIGRGERQVLGDIGLTPRAQKVLDLAREEASILGSEIIGTEHLLLGLIREGEGIAAGVLESLGVSLGRVRSEVVKIMTKQAVDPSLAPATPGLRPVTAWEYLPLLVQSRETAPREHRLVCAPVYPGQTLPHQIEGMRLHHALHILGTDGWELAGIDPAQRTEEGPASIYIFKRPQ